MKLTERPWFYPLVYIVLIIISFFPLYTEKPYNPHETQNVIFEILQVSIQPYAAWGWIFHLGTLIVIGLSIRKPALGGRVMAAYFGVNYLVIAALQTSGVTPSYGFAVHTGALVADVLLALLWLRIAWKGGLHLDWQAMPRWRWLLLPFALLVFWSPIAYQEGHFIFDFNPLLLLTSPNYGLAYCFVTPMFLFLLILAWPQVDELTFRVTAFNGLLYGLFNLSAWADPVTRVMGVMHIPLLVLPLVALGLTRKTPSVKKS